ncbi:hypothetical protein JWF52_02330 [Clostridium sp. CCUG 7971]|nr:hypothetical protein [Clostridium sp. CCUG 7971]
MNSLLLLAIVIVFLQYILYNYDKVLKIPVFIRTTIHYISLLGIFIASSKIFNWFDLSNMNNILTFSSIFTIIYICILYL